MRSEAEVRAMVADLEARMLEARMRDAPLPSRLGGSLLALRWALGGDTAAEAMGKVLRRIAEGEGARP